MNYLNPSGINNNFREVVVNEDVSFNSKTGRSARTLLSQLISVMENDSSFKQDYYKDILRTLLGQVKINFINDQDQRVDVKIHHGRQDRLVGKKFQDNNIVLPYASIYQSSVENHSDRLRSNQTIIAKSVWDENKQRALRVVSLANVPVKLTYKLSVWARYIGDMDQIAASIRSKFHPDIILQTPHSHLTKAFLQSEEDDGAVDARDREDRLIRKNFDIVIETYIPQPEYLVTSTGKIEKFNTNIDIQD